MKIPTYKEVFRIAPITLIILSIAGASGYAVYLLTGEHIETQKGFIEYLKGK